MHGFSCHTLSDCKAVKKIDDCVEQCYMSSLFANRDELMLFTAALTVSCDPSPKRASDLPRSRTPFDQVCQLSSLRNRVHILLSFPQIPFELY